MRKINRRNFLKVTGVLAAASALGRLRRQQHFYRRLHRAAPPVPLPALTVQRLTMS